MEIIFQQSPAHKKAAIVFSDSGFFIGSALS